MWVWSSLRAVLAKEPYAFTSLNSRAYWLLVSSFGPFDMNLAGSSTRNGFTSFSQAFGSFTNRGRTGRHSPGRVPTGNRYGPKRPSFVRAAIIAAAAASPTAIPPAFAAGPSEIAPSEAAYCV